MSALAREKETRREARAFAKGDAAEMQRLHGRLARLYEISKVLTRFASVERTVPEVLALVSEAVPLRSAVLMLEDRTTSSPRTRAIIWHGENVNASQLRAARAHAKTAYTSLVRSAPDLEEEAGAAPIPESTRPPALGREGFVVLPLVVGRREIFGALQLEGFARLDEADLTFANAVVNQLAIALDRIAVVLAKQVAAKAGQVSSEFLANASAALFSSLEHEKTLAAVVHAAVPHLADMCLLDEITEDGRIERAHVVFADPGKQPLADKVRALARDPEVPTAQALMLRWGGAVLFESFDALAHAQARAELDFVDELGVQSMMIVPLTARGRTLGALTLVMAESRRRYSASDLVLAKELGHRASIAIDNARLYARAERAVQARQELIATVSHDLRNPLSNIVLSAALLLRAPSTDGPAAREKQIGVIQRSADRMNRIILDLLDVASINAGHLAIERKSHPAAALVSDAIELSAATAARMMLRLEGALVGDGLEVDCDRDRLLQVFGNLIGNAIKFTPEGGTIKVSAEPREGGETLFSVADTGPGIPLDDLPHVFDRYWQARKTARLGTGLGLSISKGIVEAHDGRIWAESAPGQGATFFFTIPRNTR